MFTVATVVEGHGEVAAVPVLLRRLHPEFLYPRPIRVMRNRIVDHKELKRYLRIADAAIQDSSANGGVLILLDADEDCAVELSRRVHNLSRDLLPNRAVEVVIPVRCFEAWLIAGRVVESDVDAEAIANPKRSLRAGLGRYSPTADQAALASRMNIDDAKLASRSFRRLLSAMNTFRQLNADDAPDEQP